MGRKKEGEKEGRGGKFLEEKKKEKRRGRKDERSMSFLTYRRMGKVMHRKAAFLKTD